MTTVAEALRSAAAYLQAGHQGEAEQVCRQILAGNPQNPSVLLQLGLFWQNHGRDSEAEACYARAILLQPSLAEAHHSLGILRQHQGRGDEAVAAYQRALGCKPDYFEAHYNLGNTLRDLGRLDEAIASFQRALATNPSFAAAAMNLGNLWAQQGRLDEAADCYRRALEIKPDYAKALNNLGNASKDQGNVDLALACFRRAIALQGDFAAAQSNFLYTLWFCPGYDAQRIYAEHRRWNQECAARLAPSSRPLAESRGEQRLRIGYVSPDFGDHVVGRNLLPLVREHDRQQFEIVAYATRRRHDGLAELFRSHADVWRDVAGATDDALAQQIRDDRIDILVDTALHLDRNRILVFARQPAPVQVTFAGYPGTTGLSAIDYRLTDPYLDPPPASGQPDAEAYSEQSIRLPYSFWCYDPPSTGPPISPLPATRTGQVTFGALNNFCKVNAQGLALWARVLRGVAGSRLMLLAPVGSPRQTVLDVLAREGVAADRVSFVSKRPHEQYLESYQAIDIVLDTLPYNGHTTSLDALWMGVPVVTLVGQTVVGRAGRSQLMNLDLPELIAETSDGFVEIATQLAGDLARLGKLRATLRPRMQASPLMDAAGFARGVEAAYRQMWQRAVSG